MNNRPEADQRNESVKGEIEAHQRSALSNRALTQSDLMSSVETACSHIRNGKQGFRESRPHSTGPVTAAFIATALVVTGTLVVTGVLLLIIASIPLGIDAAQSVDIRVLARQITWDTGTTIAAITIFAGTYLFIAIGKLPGYQLDRAGAALLGASLMVGLGIISLDQAYRARSISTLSRSCSA
jgi:hypothetical protein